jgi:hypothetical protein
MRNRKSDHISHLELESSYALAPTAMYYLLANNRGASNHRYREPAPIPVLFNVTLIRAGHINGRTSNTMGTGFMGNIL